MRKILNRLLLAIAFGILVGTIYFIAFVSAAFMVGGDGTAPVFTHVMLALNEFPNNLFGKGAAQYAIYIYGAVSAVVFFVYLYVKKIEP